jgi:hypothetical protein
MEAYSQFNPQSNQLYSFQEPIFAASKKTIVPGLSSDPIGNYRISSPLMLTNSGYGFDNRMQNLFFWTGNITTMSYNKGKFGTYFYWDVQGNLRGTRGFIDISGKNKRGLKLTFLWRANSKIKF